VRRNALAWLSLMLLAVAAWSSLTGDRRGTDDGAMAHVLDTHPSFQPTPGPRLQLSERTISLGMLAQGAAGAVLFLAICARLRGRSAHGG
jgi:hypothetical protein